VEPEKFWKTLKNSFYTVVSVFTGTAVLNRKNLQKTLKGVI
jgi:hypothetical protein